VDPKAEAFYGWSGYNSNLDNPILNKDPLGDVPGWYELQGNSNQKHFDSAINSQKDLDKTGKTGTYIGESAFKVDEVSGATTSYNADGTVSDAVPLPEVEVAPHSIGYDFELYTGLSASLEVSIGPQIGLILGKTEVQGGGNMVLGSFSTGTGGSEFGQVNIFAEATKNNFWAAGGEVSLSGSNFEKFNYQAGAGIGPVAIQAEGYIGPGDNKHNIGFDISDRQIVPQIYGIKAIIGLKLEIERK
jgi:hypothetical protein